jgi:hypothetical protein
MSDASAYDRLLEEVCVELGFCGAIVDAKPLHVDQFVPDQGSVSADEFVDWVFKAEGWNPSAREAQEYRLSLREAFIRHMGGEAVDAQAFWPR